MRCAMCGYEFDAEGLACHASCPLSPNCAVVCCPRCGYSTVNPGRSTFMGWVQRLVGKRETPAAVRGDGAIPLLQLRPGQEAEVVSVGESHPEQTLHLGHFGLLPGMTLRLRQTKPVPIVRIAETDLALDAAVAAEIFVATKFTRHSLDKL